MKRNQSPRLETSPPRKRRRKSRRRRTESTALLPYPVGVPETPVAAIGLLAENSDADLRLFMIVLSTLARRTVDEEQVADLPLRPGPTESRVSSAAAASAPRAECAEHGRASA